jgi:hypothetical protein
VSVLFACLPKFLAQDIVQRRALAIESRHWHGALLLSHNPKCRVAPLGSHVLAFLLRSNAFHRFPPQYGAENDTDWTILTGGTSPCL